MGDAHYGNAMTEVALALSMAFFSIMILAMVSMSAVHEVAQAPQDAPDKTLAAKLASAKPDASKAGAASPNAEDTLIVYHQGKFLDRDLNPLDPNTVQSGGRVILALSPETAMAEALKARSAIGTENLIVSMLNEKWLAALKRRQTQEN
jgi:hypothetical protein